MPDAVGGTARTTLGLWLDPPAAGPTGPLADDLMALGQALEAGHFEWLWLSDPTAEGTEAGDDAIGVEPFTLAGALAVTTLRLGFGIVPAPSRLPSMLAKLTTSLDVISQGRAALGVRLDETTGGEGVARATEALQLCRAMFCDDDPTFTGRFYRIEGAINRPGPVRPGGIPATAFVPGGEGLSGRAATALLPLVDGVVVQGDERTTARAADHLEAAARSAGRLANPVRLIWATTPLDTATGLTRLVEDVRRQRAVGATGILVRMAGPSTPARVAEIAGRLSEPLGRSLRSPATA